MLRATHRAIKLYEERNIIMKSKVTIRMGASYHEAVINGQSIDLSGTQEFKHGKVKTNRHADRASSLIIADMQSRGFFQKKPDAEGV